MTRKQLLVIVLIVLFVLALLPLEPARGEAGSETGIVFAGDAPGCLEAEG